ncbi:DUF89 family protein [candidate division KSB1 bacterium]|nr:DUF89 family protein [candidate division KSB1 bacterium]
MQKLLNNNLIPEEAREPAMRQLLQYLAKADYRQSPAALGGEMHRLIRGILNNPDPYKDVKIKYNKKMIEQYPQFKKMVTTAAEPFNAAMRLAIAGNVIDFGPQNRLDIMNTINKVIHAPLKIDDSGQLKKDIESAKTILYIGDNCGEIVLDKLFVETINHPNIYFAVRKSPVINDATPEDARMIGLDKMVHLLTTGDDSPGAVWETASDEFKTIFQKADVIIAKGQGNLEGLMGVRQNIYYLLVVKCEIIGQQIGAQTGDYIVKRLKSDT